MCISRVSGHCDVALPKERLEIVKQEKFLYVRKQILSKCLNPGSQSQEKSAELVQHMYIIHIYILYYMFMRQKHILFTDITNLHTSLI